MTGRTHDLAAFTAMTAALVLYPPHDISLATVIVAFGTNMIGGLAPDLDQSTAGLWHKMRGGSLFGRIFSPILGGHRHISHSILGIIIVGILMKWLLSLIGTVLLVDMDIIWWVFMLGFISHIVMDLLTEDGVPLLFPLPYHFGIPPLRIFRIKTGGIIEKSFVFPGLIVLTGYLFYTHYDTILDFLRLLK